MSREAAVTEGHGFGSMINYLRLWFYHLISGDDTSTYLTRSHKENAQHSVWSGGFPSSSP